LTADRETSQNEVLRRVGRNLLLFQQLEHFLKFLLANQKATGTEETWQADQQKQADCIKKMMLGQLVNKFGNDVLRNSGREDPEEDRPAGWVSVTWHMSGDADFVDSMRRDLKLMTDERNELVHQFLPRWQPDSPGEMAETLAYLDNQRERLLPMHERLKSTVSRMQEARRLLLNFMDSPEYEKTSELMWLQGSPLVTFLRNVASRHQRNGGWTDLSRAGGLAAKKLPEEMKSLSQCYGFKTLRKLLIGCELFDVLDEPLPAGYFRTMYRLKGKH
jgi:hypothetical protein